MVPIELKSWAIRHHVSLEALHELSGLLASDTTTVREGTGSESRVQSQVRLAAPYAGIRLFRNNVGVLTNDRGTPVRYGLANDSPALNKRLKSSDLIGWRRLEITPAMVGTVVAQFVSLETKHESWTYSGSDHEEAQQRWLGLVAADGGYAKFVTNGGDI